MGILPLIKRQCEKKLLKSRRTTRAYAKGEWSFKTGKGREAMDMYNQEINVIFSGLKRLMHHKYGDIILLFSLIAAFGMLLAVSALG